jgi:hypothetical protein
LKAGWLTPHAIASRMGVRLRLTLLFGGLFLIADLTFPPVPDWFAPPEGAAPSAWELVH